LHINSSEPIPASELYQSTLAHSGLAIPPARLDLGPVSNSPGLNNLLQQLLQHSWQERPLPVQAQHILTQAQHQTNQTIGQSNRAAQAVPADPAGLYVSLQDLQAVIAALQKFRDNDAHKGQQVRQYWVLTSAKSSPEREYTQAY